MARVRFNSPSPAERGSAPMVRGARLFIKNLIRKIFFLFYYNFFLKRKNRDTAFEKIGPYKFTIPPTVFNPTEYYSSEIFADFIRRLDNLNGKHVLDMGCGSGIVSVFAAAAGASSLAVDINPMSVKAAKQNALRNGFADKVEVLESDLFSKFPSPSGNGDAVGPGRDRLFDIIFFNPPFFRGVAQSNFELAFKGGENYEVIRTFIKESKNFLKPDGEIYFIVSSDMDINLLEQMFREEGFEFIIKEKTGKLLETFYITNSFLIK